MCETSSGTNLLSLPVEMLHFISQFLSARDILALSGTCLHLRTVLNDNSIWCKFTQGNVGETLSTVNSVVEPNLCTSDSESLEPLCEKRTSFLNQSRLINNIRNGKYLTNSIDFHGYLTEFETSKPLNQHKIIYKSIYLFSLDYFGDMDECIKVFNIESKPILLTKFKLEKHVSDYSVIIYFEVHGDTLLVRQDDWIDIYDIRLPSLNFTVHHSFNINESSSESIIETVLAIENLLFVENSSRKVIEVWNLSSGKKLNNTFLKAPQPDLDFSILGLSENKKLMLLSAGFSNENCPTPHLFVYNVQSLEFTPFSVDVTKNALNSKMFGLLDENFVIFLSSNGYLSCEVSVFKMKTSTKVAQRTLKGYNFNLSRIFEGRLILPNLGGIINVVDIKTLELIGELVLNTTVFVFESPGLQLFNIGSQCHLIVVDVANRTEVWDLTQKRKLFDLPSGIIITFNDNFSKLILHLSCSALQVISFW